MSYRLSKKNPLLFALVGDLLIFAQVETIGLASDIIIYYFTERIVSTESQKVK